ncbi:leucine-rich repeat and IQ domain-containing protein 3 [Engraulis encrasicolus]|uniref:leucine-rich repeat and IQ domain-containing protein 3 n=1 Tax=Engraulis encrasicolus TaxID=184585 RepID=UPI002FD10EB1
MAVQDVQKFLVSCTASLILEHGVQEQDGEDPTLQEMAMVKLGGHMLKNVVNFGGCSSLRICILSGNFITNIAALSGCVHLVKLDLSGNQITQLPDAVYWNKFTELLLLNLHDNNMSTRKHIGGLSCCPNLIALTMHDTPLSLKANYRHCIVNTLWSLKALDNYVISDEEIIEGFTLSPKFRKMAPNLAINLHPTPIMETFKDEMWSVRQIISKINRIQAKFSPTLIIQRCIRGHLVRKCLCVRQPWRKTRKLLTPITSKGTTAEDHSIPDKQSVFVTNFSVADKQTDVTGEDKSSNKKLNAPFNTPQLSKVLRSGTSRDDIGMSNRFQSLALDTTGILFGSKAVLHQAEPMYDMLLARRQDGINVRGDINQLHTLKPINPPPTRHPMVIAKQRLVERCNAGIDLEVFQTIERCNRAREHKAAVRMKADEVANALARREEAKDYRDTFMESRRKEAQLLKQQEQSELQEALTRLKNSRNQYVQHARERYSQYLESRKIQQYEQVKMNRFCGHHLSLSKVVAKQHAKQRNSIITQEKHSLVMSARTHEILQRKLVKDHLDRRRQSFRDSAARSRRTRDVHKKKVQCNLFRAKGVGPKTKPSLMTVPKKVIVFPKIA